MTNNVSVRRTAAGYLVSVSGRDPRFFTSLSAAESHAEIASLTSGRTVVRIGY